MAYKSPFPNQRELVEMRQYIPKWLPFDRLSLVLVVLSAVIALGSVVFLALSWDKVPQIIPTHYGLSGQPDRWGSKNSAIGVTALFVALVALLSLVACLPRLWNLAYRIDERTALAMLTVTRRLLCWLDLLLALVTAENVWRTVRDDGASAPTLLLVAAMVVALIYHLYLMKQISRQMER